MENNDNKQSHSCQYIFLNPGDLVIYLPFTINFINNLIYNRSTDGKIV